MRFRHATVQFSLNVRSFYPSLTVLSTFLCLARGYRSNSHFYGPATPLAVRSGDAMARDFFHLLNDALCGDQQTTHNRKCYKALGGALVF
ncbi:hypothetical protein C8R44DRAFT_774232 [Mycena epipterygia]|nr:hypothetical protein C8R44DRAFT_774232 [Mycena epipterygia]